MSSTHTPLPSVVLMSPSDVTCYKVLPFGFQTKVTEPLFFTFVESAAATIPSTCVHGLVAAALTTKTYYKVSPLGFKQRLLNLRSSLLS